MANSRLLSVLLSLALALFGSGVYAHAKSGAHKKFEPRVLKDINPDSKIVEVVLVAKESKVRFKKGGKKTRVYTYNGSIPGPTIEANLGDRLIVHFYNKLPEPTTVHWHGVELPANMDGSNLAQNPVEPGGYFKYEFDLNVAALFWFHPHIRTNEQVEKGLYGSLIVHDRDEDKALGLPSNNHILVLDDILLDARGQVAEPFPDDPLDKALSIINGRLGNTQLVNGKVKRKLHVRRGVPQRLRIVNVSNSRFMRLSIPGHRMWRIGGDGGLLTAPIAIEPVGMIEDPDNPGNMISDPDPDKGLLLTPGERADIVFTPLGNARRVALESHDIARGLHSAFFKPDGSIGLGDDEADGKQPPVELMTFKLRGKKRHATEYLPPSALRYIEPIDTTGAATLPVMFGHMPPTPTGDVTFFAAMKDGKPLPFDMVTADDAFVVSPNEVRIIEVNNMTGGDHNYHLHGFSFQHIETQYIDMDNPDNNMTVPAAFQEVKDTILVPRRPGAMMRSRTVVRLAVKFDDTGREGQISASGKTPDDTNSGGWVFHCHILEHSDSGMMSFVQVVE